MKDILKILKNRKWKVKYKNLEKKYNELIEENSKLKKKLDDNYLTRSLHNRNATIKHQKEIIKNLRADNKKLMEKSKGE